MTNPEGYLYIDLWSKEGSAGEDLDDRTFLSSLTEIGGMPRITLANRFRLM